MWRLATRHVRHGAIDPPREAQVGAGAATAASEVVVDDRGRLLARAADGSCVPCLGVTLDADGRLCADTTGAPTGGATLRALGRVVERPDGGLLEVVDGVARPVEGRLVTSGGGRIYALTGLSGEPPPAPPLPGPAGATPPSTLGAAPPAVPTRRREVSRAGRVRGARRRTAPSPGVANAPSLQVSPRVWVITDDWASCPDGAVTIRLRPGGAFGLGDHETTKLCARGIDNLCQQAPPARVLDVGTGTGVLALMALKLGAQQAVGTDIDPEAVLAARENARINGLQNRFQVLETPPDHGGAVYDLVVANILANDILDLSQSLTRATAPGGTLFVCGILELQEDLVRSTFEGLGLVFLGSEALDGWVRLDFSRPSL
jgi:hypothetical protein